MTLAYFLVFNGAAKDGDAFREWFQGAPVNALAELPELTGFDLYTPAAEGADDPYLDDGDGPLVQAQLYFEDEDGLIGALTSEAFQEQLAVYANRPVRADLISDAMEMQFFPVAGESEPAPLTAPVSYVVRYHRPAEDEAGFIENYIQKHPPILGKFPNIRNVICYLPIGFEDPNGLESADYLLGNEVVFDSLQDLNAALQSPVRHELREDFKTFPSFTGANTHYAMIRNRLV